MRVTLIRNATLLLEIGTQRVLVDPALDEAGARPPVENTRAEVRAALPRVLVPEDGETLDV